MNLSILPNWVFVWVPKLVAVIIILILAEVVSKYFLKYFEKAIGKRIGRTTFKLIHHFLKVLIFLIALILILGILNIKSLLLPLLTSAGIIGIILGFALKDTLGNVFAGISLIMDKPFKVGDAIKVKNLRGIVEDIGFRSVRLKTFDNKLVILPNSEVSKEYLINYSIEDPKLRMDISVSISYESNLKKAIKVLLDVAKKEKSVLKDPKPEVSVDNFGESSIDLILRVWIPGIEYRIVVPSNLRESIRVAFKKENIEIPYPRRVILKK